MDLEDMILRAMSGKEETEKPKLSVAEEKQLLLNARAALLQRNEFTPGQFVRIKTGMNFGLFEDGNNIFLFDRMLDQPIDDPEGAGPFSRCFTFDCVVYYVTSHGECTCRILPSIWFEAAE